jgi:predicted TIM-barrel fold metal-dependent hydrolase
MKLPESLKPFAGRILDTDSHEQMPAQIWEREFGEIAKPLAAAMMNQPPSNPNHANCEGYVDDTMEINPDRIWKQKGPRSPGAVDMRRRLDVMDQMAVARQLMFPTSLGLWGTALYSTPKGSLLYEKFGGEGAYDYAKKLFDANNRWAVNAAKVSDRIRPVTPVYGDTVEELIAVTKPLIDSGIKAISLVASRPPAGFSPAALALTPFYSMLDEANVALTMHLGGEKLFIADQTWGKAEAFEGYKINEEISMDPWWLSTFHLAPQNFVATMTAGGVFDRHPKLRVGILEYGAHWIGPMAAMLDLWHDNNQSVGIKVFADGTESRRLPLRPSEYLARNVRIAPYDFEDVGKYIHLHGLEECYCFASDYPHIEGGIEPLDKLVASLQPLGPKVMEKFFVSNGELLLPA